MRLQVVWISEYKNLKNFSLKFESDSFVELFVGKNGSGKSNFFEALVEIFRHLIDSESSASSIDFNYKVQYEIEDKTILIEWEDDHFLIDGKERKSLGKTPLPNNVIIYYSGHNPKITELASAFDTHFERGRKDASPNESRKLIGIGSSYKPLLLSVILSVDTNNTAKNFIVEKLGIASVGPNLIVKLVRPAFADSQLKKLELDAIDDFDPRSHYWGAEGVTKEYLVKLFRCVKGETKHSDIYNKGADFYSFKIDLELFRAEFADLGLDKVFNFFDGLKALKMLDTIALDIILRNGAKADVAHFSDGQFQSIYIYTVAQIFKELNCLTFLDEPDAFLHPEWQFSFLEQFFKINEATSKKNHIFMSTHSASTVTRADEKSIRLFSFGENGVESSKVSKSYVIDDLSKGLLAYSEDENLLRIDNVVRLSNRPVLFVEGPSDVSILETAYQKLYNTRDIPFLIQDMFDSGCIKVLLKRQELFTRYPEKPFIGLFDFDTQGYGDWTEFTTGWGDAVTQLEVGLAKKREAYKSYVFLLPVREGVVRNQVWNENNQINKILPSPHYCIEHIFYDVAEASSYFKTENGKIRFKGDKYKIKFAQDVVPTFQVAAFEPLRAFFEKIKDL